jgi:hypothetical protein
MKCYPQNECGLYDESFPFNKSKYLPHPDIMTIEEALSAAGHWPQEFLESECKRLEAPLNAFQHGSISSHRSRQIIAIKACIQVTTTRVDIFL